MRPRPAHALPIAITGLLIALAPAAAQDTASVPRAERPDTTPRRPAAAQPPRVVITGQMRLRSEDDARRVLAGEPVWLHLLRTRLRATARPAPGFTVVGEVQDARYLGEGDPAQGRGTTDASAPALDMHQAWAQVDRPLRLPLELRVGRQEMSFANERLIGTSPFSNTGRSFDGARVTVHAARALTVDAFADRLAAPSAAATAGQDFYGAWAAWKPSPTLQADAFALRDDNTAPIRRGVDQGRPVLARYTLGGNLRGTAGLLAAELEGAAQRGHGAASDSTARDEIRAWFGSVTANVTVIPRTQTQLGGLVTVLSGDGDPADGRDERFNTLFGTNHRFYGLIDYVPELGGSHGVIDAAATLAHQPIPAVKLLLEAHRLLPHRGAGAFGSEADLTATWRAAPAFELSAGASAFHTGALLEPRVGPGTHYWAFVAGLWEF
ncbi:MAG TPA: alginate export family protein [Longimicrobium sp.]|nr:alginate export family protein [Longimicrobium sp.]